MLGTLDRIFEEVRPSNNHNGRSKQFKDIIWFFERRTSHHGAELIEPIARAVYIPKGAAYAIVGEYVTTMGVLPIRTPEENLAYAELRRHQLAFDAVTASENSVVYPHICPSGSGFGSLDAVFTYYVPDFDEAISLVQVLGESSRYRMSQLINLSPSQPSQAAVSKFQA